MKLANIALSRDGDIILVREKTQRFWENKK